MSSHNRESGFSLLETMMALGLTAVVSLAVAQVMVHSAKTQKGTMVRDTFNQIVGGASMVLMNEALCSASLKNQTFDPANAAGSEVRLTYPDGTLIATQGFTLPDNSLAFTSVKLVPVAVMEKWKIYVGGTLTNVQSSIANLQIQANRTAEAMASQQIGSYVLNIPIATDMSTNKVLFCSGTTNATAYGICQANLSAPNAPALCNSAAFPNPPAIFCLNGSSSPCP